MNPFTDDRESRVEAFAGPMTPAQATLFQQEKEADKSQWVNPDDVMFERDPFLHPIDPKLAEAKVARQEREAGPQPLTEFVDDDPVDMDYSDSRLKEMGTLPDRLRPRGGSGTVLPPRLLGTGVAKEADPEPEPFAVARKSVLAFQDGANRAKAVRNWESEQRSKILQLKARVLQGGGMTAASRSGQQELFSMIGLLEEQVAQKKALFSEEIGGPAYEKLPEADRRIVNGFLSQGLDPVDAFTYAGQNAAVSQSLTEIGAFSDEPGARSRAEKSLIDKGVIQRNEAGAYIYGPGVTDELFFKAAQSLPGGQTIGVRNPAGSSSSKVAGSPLAAQAAARSKDIKALEEYRKIAPAAQHPTLDAEIAALRQVNPGDDLLAAVEKDTTFDKATFDGYGIAESVYRLSDKGMFTPTAETKATNKLAIGHKGNVSLVTVNPGDLPPIYKVGDSYSTTPPSGDAKPANPLDAAAYFAQKGGTSAKGGHGFGQVGEFYQDIVDLIPGTPKRSGDDADNRYLRPAGGMGQAARHAASAVPAPAARQVAGWLLGGNNEEYDWQMKFNRLVDRRKRSLEKSQEEEDWM